MNSYTLVLFAHLCGVMGIFIAVGAWLLGLIRLRRARSVAEVRAMCDLLRLADPLMVGSILLLLAAGIYMAVTVWGITTGWIIVALVSVAGMAPIGPLVAEPRLKRLAALAQTLPDGPLTAEAQRHATDPVMGTALQTLCTLLLGIEFLMTNKPPLLFAIGVMAIALVVGVVAGAALWRRKPQVYDVPIPLK